MRNNDEIIYLDHNSTTPIDPRVVDAMTECHRSIDGNPASQHRLGQKARAVLEDARERIASILNIQIAPPNGDRLIITSGGTESNNLAIFRLASDKTKRICVSAIEHPSVLGPVDQLRRKGFPIEVVPVTNSGHVDPNRFQESLSNQAAPSVQLAIVMVGNNEIGTLQPISDLAAIAHEHRCLFHADAAQAVGKIDVDFQDMNVSSLSFAAHKFHGPVGIGALALRRGTTLRPLLFGGSQQLEFRPGTESVALTVGMATALEIWNQERKDREQRMKDLLQRLEQSLVDGDNTVVVNGAAPRLPNTLNVSFPGIDRQALLMALDFAGLACSTGSACSSGSSEPSHVLAAMGLPENVISGSIRLSLGSTTTDADIAEAARRILLCVKNLRSNSF